MILKSDLEGMDVVVIANFSSSLWEKIGSGVIEIWSNGNLELEDIQTFVNVLRGFSWKSWDSSGETPIGSEELFDFLILGSGEIRSLYFKRI